MADCLAQRVADRVCPSDSDPDSDSLGDAAAVPGPGNHRSDDLAARVAESEPDQLDCRPHHSDEDHLHHRLCQSER